MLFIVVVIGIYVIIVGMKIINFYAKNVKKKEKLLPYVKLKIIEFL